MTRRLAALAAVLALVAGCGGSGEAGDDGDDPVAAVSGTASTGFAGTVVQQPYPLPDAGFTDTAGRPYVPVEDATKPVTLVFFGYTHCPDICNTVLANVASALRRADDRVRTRVGLLFVSTDPDRDTPVVVREYLDRFDPSYVGLTAPEPTIRRVAADLNIAYAGKEPAEGGGYEVSHGTQVTAFTGGRARVIWRAETSVRDLRADLTRLANQAR
jgi:protein SCO1